MSIHRISLLAAKEVVKCWRSLSHDIEDDFLSERTLQNKVKEVRTVYTEFKRNSIKRPNAFLKNKRKTDSFLSRVFNPFYSSRDTAKSKPFRVIDRKNLLPHQLSCKIKPSVLVTPSFDNCLKALISPSSWLGQEALNEGIENGLVDITDIAFSEGDEFFVMDRL